MNLDRLAQFLHVVESGSVTAAARLAHLTQPAVTRSLKCLEDELGTTLFERRGRGVVLTAAGRALVPEARALLARAAQLRRRVKQSTAHGYFDLRVGMIDSVATYLFPGILAPFRDDYPDLGLKLITGRSKHLLQLLERDALDLALMASSGPPAYGRSWRVGRYNLQYYGHRERFAALAEVTDPRQLLNFPIVQIDAGPGQASLIRDDSESYVVANSLAAVKAYVLQGFGVGTLMAFMLDDEERTQLVRANVPHDLDCALFLVANPNWTSLIADAVVTTLLDGLSPSFHTV